MIFIFLENLFKMIIFFSEFVDRYKKYFLDFILFGFYFDRIDFFKERNVIFKN